MALSPGPPVIEETKYARPIQKRDAISIRTKDNMIHPTLEIIKNGKTAHEITRNSTNGYDHRSLTLTPDGKAAISGGNNGNITSYNTQTGKKLLDFIGHTSTIWSVAVSPDNRLLVSGSADQTIKLWELKTGKLLMTLFYGIDDEWVAWTPEGFFASSENGARYVGYHINRGIDKSADYVKVDQVYGLFYRPDLVAKKIQGGFEDEIATELARIGNIDEIVASGLAPKISITTKNNIQVKGKTFTLDFSLHDKGGGIGKIEYRVDGVLRFTTSLDEIIQKRGNDVMGARPSGVISRESREFTLPHGQHDVSVTAGIDVSRMLAYRSMEEKTAIERLKKSSGWAVLAATSDSQKATEGYQGYGVFTYAILEGLKGKADNPKDKDGVIGIDELAKFVRSKVPEITMKEYGYTQIPMPLIHGYPFPIGCARGFGKPGCKE